MVGLLSKHKRVTLLKFVHNVGARWDGRAEPARRRTDSDGSFLLECQRNTGTFTPTWMRSLIKDEYYKVGYTVPWLQSMENFKETKEKFG